MGEQPTMISIDSEIYSGSFFGILNRDGEFWTPLAFDSEQAAKTRLTEYWGRIKWEKIKGDYKIVPVRIRLEVIANA